MGLRSRWNAGAVGRAAGAVVRPLSPGCRSGVGVPAGPAGPRPFVVNGPGWCVWIVHYLHALGDRRLAYEVGSPLVADSENV